MTAIGKPINVRCRASDPDVQPGRLGGGRISSRTDANNPNGEGGDRAGRRASERVGTAGSAAHGGRRAQAEVHHTRDRRRPPVAAARAPDVNEPVVSAVTVGCSPTITTGVPSPRRAERGKTGIARCNCADFERSTRPFSPTGFRAAASRANAVDAVSPVCGGST
jgi:hypothetical protein